MEIPILQGIYATPQAYFSSAFPVNLEPTVLPTGISNSYLRTAPGIKTFGAGPGVDRGGINWNDTCYRVMGTKLVKIDSAGAVTTIGDVGLGSLVSFSYSFSRLALISEKKLYYYDGSTLTQVTDADLGSPIDITWLNQYFILTDGTNIIVTELSDPTQINPLKYGSAESDPDPIKAVRRLGNELFAVGRYTTEVFSAIGGSGFPFQVVPGARIPVGALGTYNVTEFKDRLAILGSGHNESPGVFLAIAGSYKKISTLEIDKVLRSYSDATLSAAKLESRFHEGLRQLFIHLPDRSLVFEESSSELLGSPVWYTLTSGLSGFRQYRGQNFVYVYDKWLCGDPESSNHGYIDNKLCSHYGAHARWEFSTPIIYNGGNEALVHKLELIALTGNLPSDVSLTVSPTIATSYTLDGMSWSQERYIKVGTIGDRLRKLYWLKQGSINKWRVQRFKGNSQALLAFAKLEAEIEPLL